MLELIKLLSLRLILVKYFVKFYLKIYNSRRRREKILNFLL